MNTTPDHPTASRVVDSRVSSLASFLSGIRADVRQAMRMLKKNKGFAATALITLALGIDTMGTVIANSFNERRVLMFLWAAFAVVALLLSAVGIYGVLAYDVSQRTREIGIRGAIGASREQVIGLILRQGLWKSGIGLAIGLVGAALLSRFIKSMLYDVQAIDPLAYGAVGFLLLGVGVLASYLPARRAAKIDPIVALREE